MLATKTFDPALEKISAAVFPDRKSTGNRTLRYGLYQDDLSSLEKVFTSEYKKKVRDFEATFKLSLSKLFLGKHIYETVFVLEIEFKESQEAHLGQMNLGGFGSHLHSDYGLTAHFIAEKFCEANGLSLSKEINHWPKLQYVVFIPEDEASAQKRKW